MKSEFQQARKEHECSIARVQREVASERNEFEGRFEMIRFNAEHAMRLQKERHAELRQELASLQNESPENRRLKAELEHMKSRLKAAKGQAFA